MKEIPLTQGKFAKIDDEDFEKVNQFKWFAYIKKRKRGNVFYSARVDYNFGKKYISMHSFLIGSPPKGFETDHIDGDGLNNQKYNLRIITRSQNQYNRQVSILGSSRFKGVFKRKECKRYNASIRFGGKLINLGYYDSDYDAAIAYNNAAIKYFGEYANLNKI